jgi:hypothetical protein
VAAERINQVQFEIRRSLEEGQYPDEESKKAFIQQQIRVAQLFLRGMEDCLECIEHSEARNGPKI